MLPVCLSKRLVSFDHLRRLFGLLALAPAFAVFLASLGGIVTTALLAAFLHVTSACHSQLGEAHGRFVYRGLR